MCIRNLNKRLAMWKRDKLQGSSSSYFQTTFGKKKKAFLISQYLLCFHVFVTVT